MVSLWPFRTDTTSAESFEKSLSALSIKLSKASAQNDRLRQRSRKLKVGWTLYGGFSYILALLIFFLVTGWRNWGVMEISVVSGGPVLLYAGRYLLNTWYSYRTSNSQDYLDALCKERDDTIEKLKAATKYDSTQQLLEKYGGKGGSPSLQGKKGGEGKMNGTPKGDVKGGRGPRTSLLPQEGGKTSEQRVFLNPPATANIQRRPMSPGPGPTSPAVTEEFAPNAYDEGNPPPVPMLPNQPSRTGSQTAPPPYQQAILSGGGWMDRLVTALMGEDETLPTNRLALLCMNCRMVNGLAPPGVRTPEELGRWRCASCGAWNGVEQQQTVVLPTMVEPQADFDDNLEKEVAEEEDMKDVQKPKSKATRKGGKTKFKKEVEDDDDELAE